MIATVKAYYNTGLTVGNCLDNISQLDALGFSSHSFPNIAIKQDRGRISIRINTDYSTIKDADYVKINDIGYWVTGITMLNDNVAEVGLQQDYVTTAGISNLEIISGWCTRKCVTDDTKYTNTLDEPFSPTSPLKIDFGNEIKGSGSSDVPQTIIVSSIDLANLPLTAKAYVDAASDKVLVPDLNVVPNGSLNTLYTSHVCGASNAKSTRLPATQAYSGANQTILDALSQIRSLGVESCIVACYTVSANWVAVTESSNKITNMEDYCQYVASGLTQIPGTFKNNKVYSGQFNKIVHYSLATGDSSEDRIEDIVEYNGSVPSDNIFWFVAADPRYDGNPVCMPKTVHGSDNNKLLSCVNGAKWQSIPITYQGASGYGFMGNALQTNIDKMDTQRMYALLGGLSGIMMGSKSPGAFQGSGDFMYNADQGNGLGSFVRDNSNMGFAGNANPVGMSGKLLGGIAAMGAYNANIMYSKQALFNTYNQAMAAVETKFPRIPSFQDYVGNTFFEMRYRLSDNDMVRFDNFLTQFGYAVDEVFDTSCFSGRTHFNYVQGRDMALKKSGVPQYILEGMAKSIESGVRIWHTAPAHSKLLDNPIA